MYEMRLATGTHVTSSANIKWNNEERTRERKIVCKPFSLIVFCHITRHPADNQTQ